MHYLFILICLVFYYPITKAFVPDTAAVKKIIDETIDEKYIFGIQFEASQGEQRFQYSSGNFKNDELFFTASTTKLFVTAIILKLQDEGKLRLSDPISKFLDPETMNGLHVYNSTDYSKQITIEHLLAHTSGLPDYFDDRLPGKKKSFFEDLLAGNDRYWSFEELINLGKHIQPLFAPGTKGKAHYSDTNFQLLGKIIEIVGGMPIETAYNHYIFQPLKLNFTYVFSDVTDCRPKPMYYGKDSLHIPKAMTSFKPDGGLVSNSSDLNTFLKGFFEGKLFDPEILPNLYIWNRIMFPLQNGIGLMMAKFPGTPMFIGHSGISGAFAFYVPEKKLYLSGTVNQIEKPQISYKLISKLQRFF